MGKLCVILLLAVALVLVHATARDIPNDTINTNNQEHVADAAANGVNGQKNFLVGGWGGIGYIGGIIPILPILGVGNGAVGHGGVGGLGGVGAAGHGGVGGIGAGGAAGKVVP